MIDEATGGLVTLNALFGEDENVDYVAFNAWLKAVDEEDDENLHALAEIDDDNLGEGIHMLSDNASPIMPMSPKYAFRGLVSPTEDRAIRAGGVAPDALPLTASLYKAAADVSSAIWASIVGRIKELMSVLRSNPIITLNASRLALITFCVKLAATARPIVAAHLRATIAHLMLHLTIKVERMRAIVQALVRGKIARHLTM